MNNPLLAIELPLDYAAIQADHVAPAMDQLLANTAAALERAVSSEVADDYDALSAVLDVATERLGRAWGAVNHLNGVADTPALRAALNDKLPAVVELQTSLGADERLFAKVKAIAAKSDALTPARRQAMHNALRDFVLAGAELQGIAKTRFAVIQERSAELAQKFSENVMDATDGFAQYVSTDDLTGLPADALAASRALAQAEGKDGHKLTLHFPSYLPVMQYVKRRDLRENLYRANVTRASEFGAAERDNGPLMRELLALRQEEAQLLGHPHFAAVSLAPKMAHSAEEVCAFLRDLARKARPFAERDLTELREFAAKELGLDDLQPWDMAYATEQLQQARYAFSDQDVKPYFTEPKVLEGLFHIIETLFEVRITQGDAPVWSEGVRFYHVDRATTQAGDKAPQRVAGFYLDPYARNGKRPGAWMDDACARWARPEGSLQAPLAHLVCNFAKPASADKPALLTHDDVITLFHEFGHGLQHMLTRIDDLAVSGISGVEWDAVELASQFMENFCWEWDVVKRMTAHVDTGEPLPRELFDKMLAAKNFQNGLGTLRQVELALFDMRLHSEADSGDRVQSVLDEVRAEVSVLRVSPFNRFQHCFSHIFGGGYAAGYYSYKWAEVLSADAWSAFEDQGVLDVDTGRRWREEVLETGGSRPAMESFKAFRGREPTIDALLRHQGMS